VKRRINSTGRRRIERRHVEIRLQRTPGQERPCVEARFDLEDLELDPSAQVVLESGFKDFAQRFLWGTVACPGPQGDPTITDVPSGHRIFFRVKVVDPSSHQLLALARRMYPVSEHGDAGGRSELFRVRAETLGQELWRVVIKEDGAPILELNKDVPDVLARFREPNFRAAILPAAMRTVLLALRDDEEDQDDDPDSWAQRWFRFAGDLAGYDRPGSDDPDGIRNWIDRACNLFAERFRLVSDMIAAAERRSEP
jgi:hypothetical protein